MKSQITSMFLVLGAVGAFGGALEAQTYNVSGNVPFAFQVGDRTYEAGNYTMRQEAPSMIPMLTNNVSHRGEFVGGAFASLSGEAERKLVFHCYRGSKCFLAEVWPGNRKGITVSMSKGEKALVRENQKVATIFVDLHIGD